VLEVFGAYGVVEKVDFIPNKRFCFITFEEVESAMLAKKDLEKNEVDRFKTKLLIKFAEEEDSKEAVPEPDCTSTTADVIVPGLELIRDFLSVEDEELILSSRFGGPSSPMWIESISRRIQHFGFTFNYRTLMLDFNSESTPPFPPEFVNLARCIASYDCKEMNSVTSKCSPVSESFPINIREELTQLTLNEYYPGQGIASHIDTESVFGPDIFIISVGSGVTMTMTQQRVVPATSEDDIVGGEGDEEDTRCKKKKHVYLYPRSLLVMRGDSRYLWSHTITPRKSDKIDGELIQRGRRVSLTFRQALIPGDIPGTRLSSSAVEREHVYRVYDSIATHWHHTRGKRKVHWHRVKAFIEGLEEGSLIADIGSGDGKYFGLNASAFSIGCDRSIRLLEVSADQRHETFCCDAVKVPLRSDVFDAVLCIAVLHHIAVRTKFP
jgi:alkylated DNA repair protein alkB family protein 8